jgi:hypothetical protein
MLDASEAKFILEEALKRLHVDEPANVAACIDVRHPGSWA